MTMTYPNMKHVEGKGLAHPVGCPRCPMHFANDIELGAHLKEKHGAVA